MRTFECVMIWNSRQFALVPSTPFMEMFKGGSEDTVIIYRMLPKGLPLGDCEKKPTSVEP